VNNSTTPTATSSTTFPRYIKSKELIGQEVEILGVEETTSPDFGDEYCFDLRLASGEVVSYSRHRDGWRERGVEKIRAALVDGEPVMAALVQPGRALLWSPFDLKRPLMSSERANRLRRLGFDVTVDDDGESVLRVDDAPPHTDADAPLCDE
jgi:hypothetical protein